MRSQISSLGQQTPDFVVEARCPESRIKRAFEFGFNQLSHPILKPIQSEQISRLICS